ERGCGVEGVVGVDPDGARLDAACDAVRAFDVARPDPGREAVDRVVRERDGLLLVTERQRGEDRPEDLLAGDRVLGRDAVEDRRLEPVALRLALVERALAAAEQLRACLAAWGEAAHAPAERPLRDERADSSLGIERVAGHR